MNTLVLENKGEVKMIAHRGLSGLELENTCAAFVAAGVKSYYGIETDVHVTKDGKYVIIHDDTLERVAGLNWVVEETEFEKLRAVQLIEKDGGTRKDLCLPTLEEYVAICKKYDKQAILELKNRMTAEQVWEIAEIVKAGGWFERTTFISFAGENLEDMRKKYPSADVQFLTDTVTDETVEYLVKNKFDADLCGYCVTPDLVKKLHALGIKVNVWTLDTIEHGNMALAAGVDFITSNILE
ncbi:MAG: hypothetical protein IJV80_04410 [Clostridia bacterium]|nr:hypothetical protein [Clostridia bacterium]